MITRHLGEQPYLPIWEEMKSFTSNRDSDTPDELWLLEHPPVFTQGQAGKPEHLLNPQSIPVVQTDRGGQVTYHGPGQLVGYVLMDIKKRGIGIRTLVQQLEKIILSVLSEYNIEGNIQCGAPGVFVGDKKIASIGLRVRNGCTYHGISLNVGMDLTPFERINPCGFERLKMTQIRDFHPQIKFNEVLTQFESQFLNQFQIVK